MPKTKSMAKRKRYDIRALPEAPLFARIAAAAKARRTTLGGYLLLAAEEKLARETLAKPDGKEAA